MQRSQRIILVSHCLLNANARVRGISDWPGVHPVVPVLADRGWGLIQMPCPEMSFAGPDRAPASVEEYRTPEFTAHCARIADAVAEQIEPYVDSGCEVAAVIGVAASPSCGWEVTTSSATGTPRRVQGRGVFAEELARALEPFGIEVVDADTRHPESSAQQILALLQRR